MTKIELSVETQALVDAILALPDPLYIGLLQSVEIGIDSVQMGEENESSANAYYGVCRSLELLSPIVLACCAVRPLPPRQNWDDFLEGEAHDED